MSPGIRSNTFSIISKVLMGLLIGVIGLLVIFSIVTTCIRSLGLRQAAG